MSDAPGGHAPHIPASALRTHSERNSSEQNLVRTQGDDTTHAADGKDTMSCGQGDDRLYGGDDNDYFLVMRAMIFERQATALMR